MRKTLVNAANAMLRRVARPTSLRQFGERLCQRGQGKVARRKAKVAMARKLAVTMLAMLRSGEPYRMPADGVSAEVGRPTRPKEA